MKSGIAFLFIALAPNLAWSEHLRYDFKLGNYSYFGDWHGNLGGMTDSISAEFLVDENPSSSDPGSATYNMVQCTVSSGTFFRSFQIGSMVVNNDHTVSTGVVDDEVIWEAENPNPPSYDYPFDSLRIFLTGPRTTLSTTLAPRAGELSNFPFSLYFSPDTFNLKIADGFRIGSYVDGGVLGVTVTPAPEPQPFLMLSVGLVGLLRRTRRGK